MSQPTDQPDPSYPRQPHPGPRFENVHLLYGMALLVSALATFGAGGLLPGLVVLFIWSYVFLSKSRPRALAITLCVLFASCCPIGLLFLPAISSVRDAARRAQCVNNLKQITLALHAYHDIYRTFPPAYVADERGQPMHSWRVLILPYLEHLTLYEAYRFDEPWDGPNNRLLASQMPPTYRCPGHHGDRAGSTVTTYLAVVGPQSAWLGSAPTSLAQFTGGTSNAVLVIESDPHRVHWMEPRDIDSARALELLSVADPGRKASHRYEAFFYEYAGGRNVARADGSIWFAYDGVSEELSRTWLDITLAPGEPSETDRISAEAATRRPKLDNWFRLGVFVLLVLWPLPWVWLHPEKPEKGDRSNTVRPDTCSRG
jgi:hypothetical protein